MPRVRERGGTVTKPTTWDDVRRTDVATEQRPIEVITYGVGGHQHRGMDVRCPFCERILLVYPWSLAGAGKRCPCGAILGQVAAHRRAETTS